MGFIVTNCIVIVVMLVGQNLKFLRSARNAVLIVSFFLDAICEKNAQIHAQKKG